MIKKNITKERKRLRKFLKYLKEERMTFQEIFYNFHSWLCAKTNLYNYHLKLNMILYFNKIFKDYGYYYPKKTNCRRYKVLKHLAKVAIYNPL